MYHIASRRAADVAAHRHTRGLKSTQTLQVGGDDGSGLLTLATAKFPQDEGAVGDDQKWIGVAGILMAAHQREGTLLFCQGTLEIKQAPLHGHPTVALIDQWAGIGVIEMRLRGETGHGIMPIGDDGAADVNQITRGKAMAIKINLAAVSPHDGMGERGLRCSTTVSKRLDR